VGVDELDRRDPAAGESFGQAPGELDLDQLRHVRKVVAG
jgi:hypothetical protein